MPTRFLGLGSQAKAFSNRKFNEPVTVVGRKYFYLYTNTRKGHLENTWTSISFQIQLTCEYTGWTSTRHHGSLLQSEQGQQRQTGPTPTTASALFLETARTKIYHWDTQTCLVSHANWPMQVYPLNIFTLWILRHISILPSRATRWVITGWKSYCRTCSFWYWSWSLCLS